MSASAHLAVIITCASIAFVSEGALAQVIPGGGAGGTGGGSCMQYYRDPSGQCMSNNICGVGDYRQPAPDTYCRGLVSVSALSITPELSASGCDHFQRDLAGHCIYVNSCGFDTEVTPAPEQNCH